MLIILMLLIFLLLIILYYYNKYIVESFIEGCNDPSNFTPPNDKCGWGRYMYPCNPIHNTNWITEGTFEYNNPELNRAYRESCMPPVYTTPPVLPAPPPPQPQSPSPPPPPPPQHQTDPPPEPTPNIPTTYHKYDWTNPDDVIYPSYVNSDDNYFNYCTFGKNNHWCQQNSDFQEACKDECGIPFIA